MPATASDHNLLFGILALQVNFLARDALIKGMHAWVLEKHRPLGEILVEQGALPAHRRDMIEAMLREHLKDHDHDAQKSLAALGSVASLRMDLKQIPDTGVQASAAFIGPDPWRTEFPVSPPPDGTARYQRLRQHARGGLGEVFVALDSELQREVALKEIQDRFADHADARVRFLREAEITGKLEHPGVVPVYGLGSYPDGRPYYAMRFIRGESMHEAIRRFHKADEDPRRDPGERSLALRELLGRFVTMCNAVGYAHSRGIIHRDLKPSNAMLGEYGETLVVDWGLARLLNQPDSEATTAVRPMQLGSGGVTAPTQMGQAVGTPAFMPPEQAKGQLDRVGIASDVFALGATLYCLLSGQAPYCGPDELNQARRGDVVPARQRNGSVPAALEAVCHKAMAKRPEDRYATATALADEVQRWLAGEPVTAWPEPRAVKVARWVRKNRVLAAASAAAALVAVVLGTAGGVYRQQQRERAREQAEDGLAQVVKLRKGYRFADARAMLEQVRGWARQATDRRLDTMLNRAQADLELARDLDRVRQEAAILVEGKWDPGRVRAEYPTVLARHGLEVSQDAAGELAETIRTSEVRDDMVAALDNWARAETDPRMRQLLLQIANNADEPDVWRQAVRQAIAQGDRTAMHKLVRETGNGKPSPDVVQLLSDALGTGNEEATALLRRMQLEQPRDFWISLNRGFRLSQQKNHPEAAECFLVALALRPDSSMALYNLGTDLHGKGKMDEAIACFKKAIDIDPRFVQAHGNLGVVLKDKGNVDEAIAYYQKAIAIDAKYALVHNNLGVALVDKGKLDDAIACFNRAIDLDPRYASAHGNLGEALRKKGKVDEAIACQKRAIEIDAKLATAYSNLGIALKDKGNVDEAIVWYKKAIDIDPADANAHYNLGNALYAKRKLDEAIASFKKAVDRGPKFALAHNNLGAALKDKGKVDQAVGCYQKAIEIDPKCAPAYCNLGIVSAEKGRVDEAIDWFKKAIAVDPRDAPSHSNLGELLRQRGKLDEAVACFEKAVEIDPKLVQTLTNLGLALQGQGKLNEAVTSYAKAIKIDPKFANAHAGLGHVLMQQGEFLAAETSLRRSLSLLPLFHPVRGVVAPWLRQCRQLLDTDGKLNVFLAGKGAPADADMLARMADLAEQPYKRLNLTAARIYRDAFARRPALAGAHRYNAACAAALAGCGQGKDAAGLDDRQRAAWRKQALDWLAAELAAHAVRAKNAGGKLSVRQQLSHWREDPDLTGVRDEQSLARLPEPEREAWRTLWADVAALLKKVEQK